MNRKILYTIISLFLLGGVVSCGGKEEETPTPPVIETNNPTSTPEVDDKDDITSTPSVDSTTNKPTSTPDVNPTDNNPSVTPTPTPEVKPTPSEPEDNKMTLAEAKAICDTHENSYKGEFSEDVKVTGSVIAHIAMPGSYHMVVLSDGDTMLPLLISSSSQLSNKYKVGNKYMVEAKCGNYRNESYLNSNKVPTNLGEGAIEFKKFASDSTIEGVMDSAYQLPVEENNTTVGVNLLKFKATYVSKINDNLMLIFDGSKHIILHGKDKVNNPFQEGSIYNFYVLPSASQGKKGAEIVDFDSTGEKDSTYIEKIKESAISMSIADIANTNRYNDNAKVYPYIIKVNAYLEINEIDGKLHLAFTDNLGDDPKWTQSNNKVMAVYLKNHIIDEKNVMYDKIYPYYLNKVKGEFYMVVSEYQSSYHAFQAFVIDELTLELL